MIISQLILINGLSIFFELDFTCGIIRFGWVTTTAVFTYIWLWLHIITFATGVKAIGQIKVLLIEFPLYFVNGPIEVLFNHLIKLVGVLVWVD